MLSNILTTALMVAPALAIPVIPVHDLETRDSCLDHSTKLKLWQVKQFDYHSSVVFSTPAHQNSWGYVNFTLENPAVDYTPVCAAASNQLSDFFYGTVVYDCTVEGAPLPDVDAATFTFSRPSGELQINQTWACPDADAAFAAVGGIDLDLNCRDTEWENPDWQQGEIYYTRNVDCNLVDAETPITSVQGIRSEAAQEEEE